jgi:drug/metabolite transporter (DMT)-like permease
VSDDRRNDRLAIFGSAPLFSTGGVAIKWIALGAWQVAAIRAAFAVVAVWWLVPGPVTMRRTAVVLTGVAQGCSMLLFVIANKLTTAANAIFLQSAAPLYIPILATYLLGERTTKRDLAAMAGITIGLLMFFVGAEPATATAPNPRLGDIVAVASGVAWACTVVGLRYLARENAVDASHVSEETLVPDAWIQVSASAEQADDEVGDSAAAGEVGDSMGSAAGGSRGASAGATAPGPASPGAAKGALLWGNLFVVAIALPLAWPLPETSGGDWALLVYLGTAQVALAYRLLVHAVARVPALEASLLALFEPVLNPLWAFLLLAETPSPWAFAGAATLASVTLARAAAGSRTAREPRATRPS